MSTPATFRIGRAPLQTREGRRRNRPKPSSTTRHYPLPEKFGKTWLLVPRAQLSPYQYSILLNMGHAFKDLFTAAWNLQSIFPESSNEYMFLRAFNKSDLTYKQIQTQVTNAFERNQRLRFAFKRLVNIWRARHITFVNTVDIVTQEPIQKPVYIYDWNLRKCYQFEANTILRDSTLRIMNHSSLMMESLPPRNILTNTDFTQAQCIALYKQMQRYGVTNTHWESFAHSEFSLPKLLYTYEVPMRLEILNSLFKTYSWESADILIDFIDLQYNAAKELLPDEALLYTLLKRHWCDPYICAWIHLCKKFWAAQIRPHAFTTALKDNIYKEGVKLIESKISWHTLSIKRK